MKKNENIVNFRPSGDTVRKLAVAMEALKTNNRSEVLEKAVGPHGEAGTR